MADNQTKMTGSGAGLIQRRHPNYTAVATNADFFVKSYKGGPEYIDGNLFRYFKEGDQEFKDRVSRAYRENHTQRVVDMIVSYLFKEEVKRKTTNTQLNDFHENADGKGHSIAKTMKDVAQWAMVTGRMYVCIDRKALSDAERTGTQRDNINPNAMPYLYQIFPQNVLDVAFDDAGKVKWILVKEQVRDDDSPFDGEGRIKDQFRLWLPDEWRLYSDRGEQVGQGETGLGRVPIVVIDLEPDNPWTGRSFIGDIAYLDRAVFNNWSRLDAIVCDQTFSQLIFPIEGLPAEIIEDEKLREKFLTLATNRVLLYSAQAQQPPAFISPDASQAEFILRMIERQVKQLYASLGLQGEVGEQVQAAASGVSKAYDFDKLNKMLASKADALENAEKEIVEIFSLWMGQRTPIECEIDYPEDFDVRNLADEVAIAESLSMLNISETFTKEIHKQVVLKALPKADEATQKKIFGEIDAKAIEDLTKSTFDFDNGEDQNAQQGEPKPKKQAPAKA